MVIGGDPMPPRAFRSNSHKIAATTSTRTQIATEPPWYAENPRNVSSIHRLILYSGDDGMQQWWLDGYWRNLTSYSPFWPPSKEKIVGFYHGFDSISSNLVTKDISLAYQSSEDIIGRRLIPFKSIEWDSSSVGSCANACGHRPKNWSVHLNEGFIWSPNHHLLPKSRETFHQWAALYHRWAGMMSYNSYWSFISLI